MVTSRCRCWTMGQECILANTQQKSKSTHSLHMLWFTESGSFPGLVSAVCLPSDRCLIQTHGGPVSSRLYHETSYQQWHKEQTDSSPSAILCVAGREVCVIGGHGIFHTPTHAQRRTDKDEALFWLILNSDWTGAGAVSSQSPTIYLMTHMAKSWRILRHTHTQTSNNKSQPLHSWCGVTHSRLP